MDSIHNMDDATAIRVLEGIARGYASGEKADARDARPLAIAWREMSRDIAADGKADGEADSGAQGPPHSAAETEGELARAALMWLAADPQQRQAIAAMIDGPATRHFDLGMSLGAMVTVLLILKTKGVVEYKDGKWRFKIELIELKQGPLKTVFGLFSKLALSGKS